LCEIIIARSVEEPIFHFANVVDDNEMGVTHIIRGEEHLPNTPRQILIGEALGFKQSFYAHIPRVVN
jgi:glutamyl/glutaminyl-tRNA synthetase